MLKDWPSVERPREKLLNQGAASLSDAELLAIFLRTGVQGCNVVDLARKLLTSFGSISAIYKASETEFCSRKGLRLSQVCTITSLLRNVEKTFI